MLPFTFYRSLTCLLGFRMTDGPFMKWSVTLTLHMDGSVDATAFKMIDQMDSRVTVCAWATHYPSTPGESPDVTELLQATGWFCFRA